jgi:hypothetical protein
MLRVMYMGIPFYFDWRREIPRLISNSEEIPWFYTGSHMVLLKKLHDRLHHTKLGDRSPNIFTLSLKLLTNQIAVLNYLFCVCVATTFNNCSSCSNSFHYNAFLSLTVAALFQTFLYLQIII